MPPVILTAFGNHFDIQNPDPATIDIRDIAHALSHLCRFTGHTRKFYSVAQHSVMVSRLVPKGLALEGLLHDASEAYLGDVSSPLKGLLPDYQRLEKKVQLAIVQRFGLNCSLNLKIIHDADMAALATERRDLMPQAKTELQGIDRALWKRVQNYPCAPEHIVPLPVEAAKEQFLSRYEEISKERVLDDNNSDGYETKGNQDV